MTRFISNKEIRLTLIPWLGSSIITNSSISEKLGTMLNNFDIEKHSFNYLYNKIFKNLMLIISNFTKNNVIVLDNNVKVQCTEQDIKDMSDDVLGLLFNALDINNTNFLKLNQYAINKHSLSALKCLYLNFNIFFSSNDEKAQIKRLIISLYPKHCYEDWL